MVLIFWFRALPSQLQSSWVMASDLKEEPTCIIAGGRKGGLEGGQWELAKSTDLVSMAGLPTMTFIGLLLFCFVLN